MDRIPSNLIDVLDKWNASKQERILPYEFGGFVTIYEHGLPVMYDWLTWFPEYTSFAYRNYLKYRSNALPKINGDAKGKDL